MANLITEKQKNKIKREYLVRIFSVSLLIPSTLLGAFLLAYVIPYYIAVSKKDLLAAEQFQSVIQTENNENVGESASLVVKRTLDQMKVLDVYLKNSFHPSDYFDKIIQSKNSNIRINKLSFGTVKSNEAQFFVSGIAKTRESLVAFIEDLKFKAGFSDVDSPISDFAKDRDISFTLDIKTKL